MALCGINMHVHFCYVQCNVEMVDEKGIFISEICHLWAKIGLFQVVSAPDC